jgi:hypothetical protein
MWRREALLADPAGEGLVRSRTFPKYSNSIANAMPLPISIPTQIPTPNKTLRCNTIQYKTIQNKVTYSSSGF